MAGKGRGRGESKYSPSRLRAVEKQKQALSLRIAGASYQAIAQQLGYRGESGAYKAIISAIHKTLKAPADEVRELELLRLDAMFLGLWRQAVAGDNFSIDRALKIMERRASLMGLDAPKQFKGTFDWRKEAEEKGWKAADVFEQMVNYFAQLYAESGAAPGRGSDSERDGR